MNGKIIAIRITDNGPGKPYAPHWVEDYLLYDEGKFYLSGGVGRHCVSREYAIEFVGNAHRVNQKRFAELVTAQHIASGENKKK